MKSSSAEITSKTFLSGVQPSGLQHLGNYFGAIRQHVELPSVRASDEHFYFIADYHALTTSRDPAELRERVRETAITYLALGLDAERATLFRQSDVPEVQEITWLLASTGGMGLLERAVSYKEKIERGVKPNIGLFLYPALMAADILAYDSTHVPVGADQVQHVEIAQDLAASFNAIYGDVFRRPEALLSKEHSKVPGLDGQKMSKSYGNSLWIFETGKPLAKAIARVATDSRPPEEAKDPAGVLLIDLLRLFLDPTELADWSERVRRGGPGAPGYGHLKQRLVQAVEDRFAPARARREALLADPAEVDGILERGARKARARAVATRDRAFRACGLR
ncbi:MAG TPA: tryptophan--tRNA ligase [Planctomycetota bacterium]|nr:tryptophan--tRNA ligase [Planctomycetota bacterium]